MRFNGGKLFIDLQACLEIAINSGVIGITQQQRVQPAGFRLVSLGTPDQFLMDRPQLCPACLVLDARGLQRLWQRRMLGSGLLKAFYILSSLKEILSSKMFQFASVDFK